MIADVLKLMVNANLQEPFKDITTCIPTYNRVDLLVYDLNKRYKFGNQPKLIVDDFSFKNQRKKLYKASIENRNMKIIYHDKNRGVAQAYRSGTEHIKTKFIQFLDDDDILLCKDKDKLENDILKLNNSFSVIPRYIFNIYPDSTICMGYDRSIFNSVTAEKVLLYLCKTGEMHLLKNGGIYHTQDIKNSLPENIFKVSEDYVMISRILAKNKKNAFIISDSFYYLRRMHKNSLSKNINSEKLILHLLSMFVAGYYCIDKKLITKLTFLNFLKNRFDLLHRLYKIEPEIFKILSNYINKNISIDQLISNLNIWVPELSYQNLPSEIKRF